MGRCIALLWITAALVSCAKPKDLVFVDVQQVRMIKWGLSESLVGLDLRLYNPNNQRVQMKEASAKIYANSSYLGDTNMDSVLSVPKKDTFAIPLVVKVQTLTALTNLMEALSDSSVLIRVDGTIKMGKAGVFLTYPIRYEQMQKLSDLHF